MRLASFSVENYRSITTARKIPLSNYSLLIGANNEGKSNILHALALAMRTLVEWHAIVRRMMPDGRITKVLPHGALGRYGGQTYDWETDFPLSKQMSVKSTSKTNIVLEFELDDGEIQDFRSQIGSSLNGTLPIILTYDQRGVEVGIRKPGRGQATLTKKSARIADFISKRIDFNYIPAIRTADSAAKITSLLVERELRRLESDPEYSAAIEKIEEMQQPIFRELAKTIHSTVVGFLPSVKSVELVSKREARYRSLRRDVEVMVDDGSHTRLERKGDGVQSLVALALMRHASEQNTRAGSTVIAIEEPESHLHPRAVHELRMVIENLSRKNQVVLTSHSPLFVNPSNLENTIVVKGSRAAPACHVSEVRDALGVRFGDNLHNARLVLLFEGTDDATALKAILSARSSIIKKGLQTGAIGVDHLGGASALRQKASFYNAGACLVQCFVDDDKAGRSAADRAINDKVLQIRDVNLCKVPGLDEAELEDLYDRSFYGKEFLRKFGVDPSKKPLGKTKGKWSDTMKQLFENAGKPWSDSVKSQTKSWLSEFASKNPEGIIIGALDGPLSSFIDVVHDKLPEA